MYFSMFQLLGAACVGVVSYYIDRNNYALLDNQAHLFFLLVAVACLVGTFCIYLACMISVTTASILSKLVYVSIVNRYNIISTAPSNKRGKPITNSFSSYNELSFIQLNFIKNTNIIYFLS